MNKPEQTPARGDDTSEQTAEQLDGQLRVGPYLVEKKLLINGLAATAALAVLIAITVILATGHYRAQGEIARLQKEVVQLNEDKRAAVDRYDQMRSSYAQLLAERRCEVIDGVEDCRSAGLMRPERFAESDRQFLDGRRMPRVKRPPQDGAAIPESATRPSAPEAAPGKSAPPAPRPSGMMSVDQLAQELGKIPGVSTESGKPETANRVAEDAKGKGKSGKPAP
jgi:cell division protein FtsL